MNEKRILIADDEPHVIRVMKRSLERAGCLVSEAANGEQAIEKLQQEQPDALITDIDMPRVTGRELCEWIEANIPDRAFPIVVLTSRAEIEHRTWSGEIDNLTFMEKPVSMRLLLSVLEDHLAATEVGQS